MKKVIAAALTASFLAGGVAAQTLTTMLSKVAEFKAGPGTRIVCAIDPKVLAAGTLPLSVNYRVPAGKTLDGFLMLKGELK